MLPYKPKSEKECNEMRLIPAGDYDMEVIKADRMTSKAGDPMIKVSMRIFMPDGNARVMDVFILLTDDWAWKLRALCHCVGIIDIYESGQLDAPDFAGRAGQVKLVIKKRKDTGEEQNEATFLYGEEEKAEHKATTALKAKSPVAATQPAQGHPASDDVPF